MSPALEGVEGLLLDLSGVIYVQGTTIWRGPGSCMLGREEEEDHLEEFGGVEDSLQRDGRYVEGGEFEFDIGAARQHGDARVLESVVRHEVFRKDAAGGYEEREDGEVVCHTTSCSFLALEWCVGSAVVAAGVRDISCCC